MKKTPLQLLITDHLVAAISVHWLSISHQSSDTHQWVTIKGME